MKRLVITALIPLLMMLPAGCRKSREKAAEELAEKIMESQSGGKADVDISGGKVTITSKEKGKEGTIEFSGGKDLDLPADFPSDVPVYPRAKVISQMTMGGGNRQVILQSDKPTREVYAFYSAQLPKSGWEVVQEMKMDPTYSLVGKKGSRQAAVVIGDDNNKSTISLSITEEKG